MVDLIRIQSEEGRENLSEQYKVLVDSVDKLNDLRENSNTWWASISGALIGIISYCRNVQGMEGAHKQAFLWTIVILGFVLCYTWLSSILTIKKAIDMRNRMLVECEAHLPVKIFTRSLLEVGGPIKGSISVKEAIVPLLFLAGYAFFAYMLYFYPQVSAAL